MTVFVIGSKLKDAFNMLSHYSIRWYANIMKKEPNYYCILVSALNFICEEESWKLEFGAGVQGKWYFLQYSWHKVINY